MRRHRKPQDVAVNRHTRAFLLHSRERARTHRNTHLMENGFTNVHHTLRSRTARRTECHQSSAWYNTIWAWLRRERARAMESLNSARLCVGIAHVRKQYRSHYEPSYRIGLSAEMLGRKWGCFLDVEFYFIRHVEYFVHIVYLFFYLLSTYLLHHLSCYIS